MGGKDKGLIVLHDRPMIQWGLDRLSPQVFQIFINANRSQEQYAEFGYPIVTDAVADFKGPLAGIAASLARADTPWLVSIPCDSPMLPLDLVKRLYDDVMLNGAGVGSAHDGYRLQPVFTLVHRDLLEDLVSYLESGGRKIDRWLERNMFRSVDFSDCQEMFLNINNEADALRVVACLQSSETFSSR